MDIICIPMRVALLPNDEPSVYMDVDYVD